MSARRDADRLVCHCMIVTQRDVLACIRRGAWTVEAVGEACEAGRGCGACRPVIEGLLHDAAARRGAGGPPTDQLSLLP